MLRILSGRASKNIFKEFPARGFAMIATDGERSLRESVSQFANTVIKPLVSEMDANAKMDPLLVKSLFEQVCWFRVAKSFFTVGIHGYGNSGEIRWSRSLLH